MGPVTGLLITLFIEYLQYWSTMVESLLRMISAGSRICARSTRKEQLPPR